MQYQGLPAEATIHEEDDGSNESPLDPRTHRPKDWEELQPYILSLAVLIGLVSYIAQWLFWAGYVNTSGEK